MKKLVSFLFLSVAAFTFATTIQEINAPSGNGNYYISPLKDQPVTDVEGIVTAVRYFKSMGNPEVKIGGFYMQSYTPDNDPKTSEAIYVFVVDPISVAVGDQVKVTGLLKEYKYSETALTIPVREIVKNGSTPLQVQVLSHNNLGMITPLKIGTKADPNNPNKRLIPTERFYDTDLSNTISFPNGQIDVTVNPKPFDPTTNGLDFWKSIQNMYVAVDNPVFVAPTFSASTKFPEYNNQYFVTKTTNYMLADNGEGATIRNARGGATVRLQDRQPELVMIEPGLFVQTVNNSLPLVESGAKLNNFKKSFTGVVGYTFDAWKIMYTDSTQFAMDSILNPTNALPKEVTTLAGTANQLSIASFNVENLTQQDPQEKFNNLASGIINNLKAPDILGLEEMQDDNGTGTGTTGAGATFAKLMAAISAAGGPNYEYRQIDPVNNADGGATNGNIRCGFLYNPLRVQFVDRAAPGGTDIATTAVQVINNNGQPQLSWSPGRIDPIVSTTDSAWAKSRKPLVGEFKFNDKTFFVIVNHFASKGGDKQKYSGNMQSPYLYSEKQRIQQATKVANFIQSVLAVNPTSNVIAMGDFNDYQFSNPIRRITGEDTGTPFMHALDGLLPEEERYAYVYAGCSQALDHIIVSNSIHSQNPQFDVVHINSEYLDGNRLSDHDPEVALLTIPTVGIENENFTKTMKMTSYPNPFNPSTTINFALANTANVELAIYNTVGEKVAVLANGKMNQGLNSVVWNAAKYNSGIYYAQLSVDNKMVQTSKLMLVK